MQLTVNFVLKAYFAECIHANILLCCIEDINRPTSYNSLELQVVSKQTTKTVKVNKVKVVHLI